MASLRQKDSKIPLRVDSRLKNISKIPLRVETKPKILTSTEAELKRASVIVRKKDSINPIDRSRKSTKEIPKKELKPVNLQLKWKAKENRLQPSGKIFQNKVHNNGTLKTIITDKRIKSSKPVSQALKDRNKITTQEALEKYKPVKGGRKDNPFCLSKKKIPKIIISDDPFMTCAEEKQIKNSNHPSQSDIEFVADDRMRNLILNNRELTPTILKSSSNIKISSIMERPSLYNRPKISIDPYKQALADIANYNLASEGRRISEMQKNKLYTTPLRRTAIDPYKQALADIANYDLASEGRRFSEMQKNRLYTSPLKNRNSLYKRLTFVGDPYKEALKSLAELRMHPKPKSCKKVTFKLSGEDRSSETECKYENNEKRSVEVIQPRLTDANEKCTESSIDITPEFEGNILLTSSSNPLKKVPVDSSSRPTEVLVNRQNNITCLPENTEEHEKVLINFTSTSTPSSLKTDANNEVVHDFTPILYETQNNDKYAAMFNHEIKNSILKNVNPFLNSLRASKDRHSLFSKQSECFLDKMNPKIFTPQPVSFYPRTKLCENISPEFLSKRNADILSWAPINTPLVLKSLGKQEQSPVCKKLEFKESPKETKKELSDSRENSQTFYLQNVMTRQKILDQLADQECTIFMHEATFPCELRNYLQNPIAQILNDGDEMHFVPVSFWRLS